MIFLSRLSLYVELSTCLLLRAVFFLHLEISRGTTLAAEIDQAVVELKQEIQCELVLTNNH